MSSDAYYYWRVEMREKEKKRAKERERSHNRFRDRSRTPTPERRHKRPRSSISPLSNRKRHVGEREDPREGRCLGVFGLSLFTTAQQLQDEFSKFGSIVSCEIVMDKKTKTSRGFGFVRFSSKKEAREAKQKMHDSEIEGKQIRIEYSITSRAHSPTPGIYLGYPGAETRRDGEFRRRRYSMSPIRGPRYSLSPCVGRDTSLVHRNHGRNCSKSPPKDREGPIKEWSQSSKSSKNDNFRLSKNGTDQRRQSNDNSRNRSQSRDETRFKIQSVKEPRTREKKPSKEEPRKQRREEFRREKIMSRRQSKEEPGK